MVSPLAVVSDRSKLIIYCMYVKVIINVNTRDVPRVLLECTQTHLLFVECSWNSVVNSIRHVGDVGCCGALSSYNELDFTN